MDNPLPDKLRQINCRKHNQPITFYQPSDRTPFCQICVQEKAGFIPFDQFNQKLNELVIQGKKEYDELNNQLYQLLDSLLAHKRSLNSGIEKILNTITNQINFVEQQKQQFQILVQTNIKQGSQMINVEKELKKVQNNTQDMFQVIGQLLLGLQQKFNNIDNLIGELKQTQKIVQHSNPQNKKIEIQEVQKVEKEFTNNFEYELIEEFSKHELGYCSAFAFNSNNTILIVGSGKKIIIYQFNNGRIQELQCLNNLANYIYCLYFMKKSNGFVSESIDKSITFWSVNSNNQWSAQQILKGHQGWVYCLLMNNNEDLLISGSADYKIKFWKKKYLGWSCQQTIDTNDWVYALSMNDNENKLISCGHQLKILVFNLQQGDQLWILAQIIDVNEGGYRLCFTNRNQFVFQPKTLDYLEVYDYDNFNQKFSKINQVQINKCIDCYWYFPCQFIKQLNIITVKHGNYLNIFKINQNGIYKLMHSIQYDDYRIYGRITDNGLYLITSDKAQELSQVRKLKSKND